MDKVIIHSVSHSHSGNASHPSDLETGQNGSGTNNYSKNHYHTIQLSPPPDKKDQYSSGRKGQEGNSTGDVLVKPLSPTLANSSALISFGESHPGPTDKFYLSSSNNSPFQSAAEEPDQEEDADGKDDHNDDRNPLIFKGPPCQSVFHQFLSSAKGVVKGGGKNKDTIKSDVRTEPKKLKLWPQKKQRLDGGGQLSLQYNQKTEIQPNLAISVQHPQFEEQATNCLNEGEDEDSPHDEDQEGFNRSRQRHRKKSSAQASSSGAQPRKTYCSIGILLASVSCIFFATSALIVKVSRLHPMELLCVRGALQALFISPIVFYSGSSFLGPPGSRALLLSRAVLGSVSLIMSFASIHLIPLADAATCIFTSPVFVSLFACICLKELCSWFDVVMILLTLLGVVLVSQPSFHFLSVSSEEYSWTSILGTVCGLLAAMLTALAFIVLRQLKHVHYSVVVFWFSAVLAGFGGVLMIALDGFRLPADAWELVDCVGIGICGFLGQILLTKALQIENAGPCAVARALDIVLAFFYQITLLHDTPDWTSYLGSFLVVSCVILTAFRRWYREKYGLDEGRIRTLNGRNCNYARANTRIS